MDQEGSQQDATCPLCHEPLHPGQQVYFGKGELVHAACWTTAPELTSAVTLFLKHHAGTSICHTCMSASLSIAFEDVRKIVARIRLSGVYHVAVMVCGLCGNRRVTVRTESYDPRLTERVAQLIQADPERGLCVRCISTLLGAGHDSVRQAASKLQPSDFTVVHGRCGVCQQPRLVVSVAKGVWQ